MVYRATALVIVYFIQGSLGHAVPKSPIVGITGGYPVDIEDVPFMASVHIGGYYCSGTIIKRDFVLTAASCIKREHRYDDNVRVGSSDRNKGGTKYYIAQYIPHELHDSTSPRARDYNLGLLKLSGHLTYGLKIKRIKLHSSNPKNNPGMKALVSGWGMTAPNVRTHVLHEVLVSITSLSTCMHSYKDQLLTNMTICTYDVGVGPCGADNGGPLVVRGRQVGIFTGGLAEKCGLMPSVYVNVTAHIQWINGKINHINAL